MKKYFKRLLTVLSIIVLSVAGSTTAFAGEFKQSTLDGVVYVITVLPADDYEESGSINYYTGTGFFVGQKGENPQYIITNCHVIEDFLISGGSAGTGVLQIAYDKDTYEEAYVVTYDAEKDVAILKLAKPTDQRSPLLLKTVDENYVGSSVFAVGYPYTADETIAAVNYFGKNDATVTGGRISRLVTESGSGRSLLQMDVSINHGNSGGPLVDEGGYVVGINTLGSSLDANLNYAVSIVEAIPLLKNNNIPYEVAEDSNFGLFLIIGIAGAFLIILIVIIVIISSSKKKVVPQPQTQPQPVNAAATLAEPPIPVRKLMPVIHSMSSQHLGSSTVVSSQPIFIGRDSTVCRIIFKEDTPGVSSKHCQVYFDENMKTFILTDLKSTYGTYLTNGQKLIPNVPYPLKPKDSFYLGEKENLFYVDLE